MKFETNKNLKLDIEVLLHDWFSFEPNFREWIATNMYPKVLKSNINGENRRILENIMDLRAKRYLK